MSGLSPYMRIELTRIESVSSMVSSPRKTIPLFLYSAGEIYQTPFPLANSNVNGYKKIEVFTLQKNPGIFHWPNIQ